MLMKSELFSYQEVLNVFPARAPLYPNQKNLSAAWFTDLLDDLSLQYKKLVLSDDYTDNDVKDIVNSIMTIVYDRHAEDIIFRHDSCVWESDYQLTQGNVRTCISKLVNVLNLTLPRYFPLLTKYKEISTDPIAPIKSESKGQTRFNDTPQNIGDWGDEDHTTNISNSTSETSVDTGSLMERLDAQFKNYKSIALEWSNEFNQCFLKEEQFI